MEAQEHLRHIAQARQELLWLSHALAESRQFEATLGEIVRLYKGYLVPSMIEETGRKRWRDLPKEIRPKSRKKANNLPTRRKELRAYYDQAQDLLAGILAEGFDPVAWAKKNQLAEKLTLTLGGPDGVTYMASRD